MCINYASNNELGLNDIISFITFAGVLQARYEIYYLYGVMF